MKLTADQRREMIIEMQLVDAAMTEKRWAARFGVSIPTVRRVRRESRDQLKRLIPNQSHDIHVVCFTSNRPAKRVKTA
jgi:hypothetical protein